MANDFKNAQAVGVTSVTTVYTAPAAKDSIILELDISNTIASAVTVSVEVVDTTLEKLEKEGFVRMEIDEDGDKSLVPISEIEIAIINGVKK